MSNSMSVKDRFKGLHLRDLNTMVLMGYALRANPSYISNFFPHPSPLPKGEGIRGLIFPASPIEERPDLLDGMFDDRVVGKYALAR